jgi:magnesium chelatase subunit I
MSKTSKTVPNSTLKTLADLKKSGYQSRSVKQELRDNLIEKIQKKETIFPGVLGFETTVLPDIERAILSRHNILLLGLRGQAKTRLARLLVNLLDEWMPIVAGSELNDDPMNPISRFGIDLVAEMGDKTPISWVHRDERYVEKLATPDVSVADLVGDVDPIKAATLKLPYSDERVIHFGLVPRAHRCIFVINELPDLQARIQVSLFNVLQEGDMQIRGFKLRLPIDVEFVFTANPEDYTNRGSIITPLKDRIQSQILTHYPSSIEIAKKITWQEAKIADAQKEAIRIPEIIKDLLEEISFQARASEFVDQKSGVSARLSISAAENLVSAAERRILINKESKTTTRITDFWGVVPAITGKVELVYEGEQEGAHAVAMTLLGRSVKKVFLEHFPDPEKLKKGQQRDPYGTIKAWFAGGNQVELLNDSSNKDFYDEIDGVAGLKKVVEAAVGEQNLEFYTWAEICLFGLVEFEILSREVVQSKTILKDLLTGLIRDEDFGGDWRN